MITQTLLAGMIPPEPKTNILLHDKGEGGAGTGWKENPGLVHDTAREAAEAWKTMAAAVKQRCLPPQRKQNADK